MAIEIKNATPRFIMVEAVEYKDYEDAIPIADWLGGVERVDISTGAGAVTTIEFRVFGPIGSTQEIEFKLGDWIVKDGRQITVYTVHEFRRRFEMTGGI